MTAEVRSEFKDEREIVLSAVSDSSRLPYMLACLNEALRCYPPVASGLPRIVPRGGAKVAGIWLPEGVSLTRCVAQGW